MKMFTSERFIKIVERLHYLTRDEAIILQAMLSEMINIEKQSEAKNAA